MCPSANTRGIMLFLRYNYHTTYDVSVCYRELLDHGERGLQETNEMAHHEVAHPQGNR